MITIDGYPIDAALVEDHSFDSEITDNPVEKGAPTTDHVNNLPVVITFDCVVSDHPFGEMARLRAQFAFVPGQNTSGILPSEDAYLRLQEIRDAKREVTVESSLGTHSNMVIKTLGIPRKSDDGESLRFRITFKQIVFVANERTTVRVATPAAAKTVNRNNKPAKAAKPPAPDDNASILYKLIH